MKIAFVCISIWLLKMSHPMSWLSPDEFQKKKEMEKKKGQIEVRTVDDVFSFSKNQCGRKESCVPLSHCKTYCQTVAKGELQTNLTFQRKLQRLTCKIEKQNAYICCDQKQVTEDPDGKCGVVDKKPQPIDQGHKVQCGRRFITASFIAEGEDTNPGDWPWMARLIYKNLSSSTQKVNFCGGVLVSRRHVVTAAHCLKERPTSVVLGESDTRTDYDCLDVKSGTGCQTFGRACYEEGACADKYKEIRIKNIIQHEKYEFNKCKKRPSARISRECNKIPVFDIAIIVLEEEVEFSFFIQPICLPREKRSTGPLTVTGWGNTKSGSVFGVSSHILQELNVREIPLNECRKIWESKQTSLLESHMCAKPLKPIGGSCRGDSGGPVARAKRVNSEDIFELAGIISFGTSTCGSDYPLGFTRVDAEISDWLRQQVGRDLPNH